MPDTTTSAWIALGGGIGALVIVAVAAAVAFRQWRSTSRTRDAAAALVDVHRMKLEATMDMIVGQAGEVGEHGAKLAASVEELRSDIDHMTWLFGRIPEARDSLRATLLDIVLPTSDTKEQTRG